MSSKRYLVCLSYNGAAYCGWQVQINGLSIQQVVQDAIEKVLKFRYNIVACSRTDAKVHANRFYFHIDLNVDIEPDRFKLALNINLPDDIAVNFIKIVPNDFHARYSVKKKEYIYKIWNSKVKNPFLQNLVWRYGRTINLDKMKLASNFLIGTHDFTAFCGSNSDVEDKVRTILQIGIQKSEEMVEFKIVGDGFLYKMVRIFVGTLIEVSEGLIKIEEINDILESRNRDKAGRTVPAQGLYLNEVFYYSKDIK